MRLLPLISYVSVSSGATMRPSSSMVDFLRDIAGSFAVFPALSSEFDLCYALSMLVILKNRKRHGLKYGGRKGGRWGEVGMWDGRRGGRGAYFSSWTRIRMTNTLSAYVRQSMHHAPMAVQFGRLPAGLGESEGIIVAMTSLGG